jgi:hypothetical protein
MLGVGVFVFLVRWWLGLHPGLIGLGFILGPIIEPSLIQALYIADATSIGRLFFTGVINITLIAVSALSIAFLVWTWRRDRVLVGIVGALFSVNNNFGLLAEYEYIDNNLGGLDIHSASLGLRVTF